MRSDRIVKGSRFTIVKIGGSLLGSPDLEAWLAVILASSGEVVIVPGGGPYAERVRETQRTFGFDDRAAHHMALLAMDQVAVLLASRSDRFTLAASLDETTAARTCGKTPVWLPSAMVLAAADVPASWEVTSDSLAAWLARTLGATQLLLVKSCDVEGPVTADDLARAGIVDPMFPTYVRESAAEVHVAGPAALAGAADALRNGHMPGVPVEVELSARS